MRKSLGRILFVALVMLTLFAGMSASAAKPKSKALEAARIMQNRALSPDERAKRLADIQDFKGVDTSELSEWFLGFGIGLLSLGILAKLWVVVAASARKRAESEAKSNPTARAMPTADLPMPALLKVRSTRPTPLATELQPQEKQPSSNGLLMTQAEVDAIPEDKQGVSYFTSRPMTVDSLVEVTILVGNRARTVMATREEVAQCRAGNAPLVRAFSLNGEVVPWYEWDGYEPYANYCEAEEQEWHCFPERIVACWMSADDCDPSLRGYYEEEFEEEKFVIDDDLFKQESPESESPKNAGDRPNPNPPAQKSTKDR